jgi:small conductance mechanosensitive channel
MDRMNLAWDITIVHRIIAVLLIAAATIIIAKFAEKLFKGGARKSGVPEIESTLASSILKYLIYFIGIIEIISYIGVSSIPILFAIAIVAIVIGISAHSVLENVMCGYILRMRKIFSIGELVKLDNKIGIIKDLDLIYTTIETDNHRSYIIPNSKMANIKLSNLSRSKNKFSVELNFTIPLDLSSWTIKKTVLETLEGYSGINPNLPITVSANDLVAEGVSLKVSFYVSEYEMIDGAKDLLIEEISKTLKTDSNFISKNEDKQNKKIQVNKLKPGIAIKCPMCDSDQWTGFLRCKKTSKYYLYGKCLGCDHLRFEKCPLDGEEVEFIPTMGTEREEKQNES